MKNNYILSALILGTLSMSTISCSDFLNEELTTKRNTEYLKTEEGVADLSVALYENLRYHFARENSVAFTQNGVDEFTVGGDGSNASWNSYDGNYGPTVTSNSTKPEELWDEMYVGISNANTLIQNVKEGGYTSAATMEHLGEAYFLRGFNYYTLVAQFGGVPLKLIPSTTPQREFTRASAEDCYKQIVEDLKQAYTLLPATATKTGQMTKDAAAHFLAKTLLSRVSERNDDWNASYKEQDLKDCLTYAQEVISHHALALDYSDLWNYTGPDGANEKLDEIILAAQFNADKSGNTGNSYNQTHLYYISIYKDLPYMKRDIPGEREYQRLRTSYYTYDVYDKVNDSRFWKSFKTKAAVNNPKNSTYYKKGDLGVMYVINKPGDTRYANVRMNDEVVYSKTGKTIPTVFVAYPANKNQAGDNALLDFTQFYPSLSKFIDGYRESVTDRVGTRDGILARVGETYLIAAEALVRQGKYQEALGYINTLRDRAAYKQGEDREHHVDGGAAYKSGAPGYKDNGENTYMAECSYYESNGIAETTAPTSLKITDINNLPAEDEAVIRKLGYTSAYDRMLCLVLNERTRELCGEFQRWQDLARTKTLVARARAFNSIAAANIKDYMVLRPIPQTYLDGIQKNGHALTAEEKQEQQNPGW